MKDGIIKIYLTTNFFQKLTTQKATNIFKQIVQGVAQLHKSNIIHADLTLGNILVKDISLETVAVADLGVSIDLTANPDFISEIGRYACRPPDSICSLKYDIYGLGYIGQSLFFNRDMITKPEEMKSKIMMMSRKEIEAMDSEDALEIICNCPPRKIRRLLQDCISKDMHQRPTCEEIMNLLL